MKTQENYRHFIIDLAKTVLGDDVMIKQIDRLGGLTNFNFSVDTDRGCYVFRFPGIGTEELISRKDEKNFVELADKLNIDARNIYFDPANGVKITKYIDKAITLNPETIKNKDNLDSIAALFRKLHNCDQNVNVRFDVFEKIAEYERLLSGSSYSISWPDYDKTRYSIFALETSYNQDDLSLSFCHNDPLCENFICGSDRMYLVDWEYAGMNDPFWDIADIFIEGNFTKLEEDYFLEQYLGRNPESIEITRVLMNKILLDFLWSLWGLQRHSCGENLLDYADTRYQRAKSNLQLLREG